MPKVYNVKYSGWDVDNAVYVGRPSDFGNPFSIKSTGSRTEAIKRFEKLVNNKQEFKQQIKNELRGKNLLCWCTPDPCHADILLKIANED